MIKQRKKRRMRRHRGYITIIVDEKERVEYTKKGRVRHRRYLAMMHRNNTMVRYCAFFGYRRKDFSVKHLWMKTADQCGFMRLKDELMHRYHNHLEILMGIIRLVKVKKSITSRGELPGMPNGKGLPVRRWYRIFKVLKKKKNKDFNLLIEGTDGRKFKVSSDCMARTWPTNWIEDNYLDN